MKVTISTSGGTIRGYYLAALMDARDQLNRFYAHYYSGRHPVLSRVLGSPDNRVKIESRRVADSISLYVALKLIGKYGLDRRFGFEKRFVIWDRFDRRVAKDKDFGDILFVESVMALHSLRRAKKEGAVTVIDQPNPHIETQNEIMVSEYRRWGVNKKTYSAAISMDKAKREYEEADYICCLSSFAKKTFIEKGVPEGKLLVLPPGAHLNVFRRVPKEDKKFRIIFCGIFGVKKGAPYLLEALRRLSHLDIELWVLGAVADEMKPMLANYSGPVRFYGHIPQIELHRYICQGSVSVLPSVEEGFGKVIMESMACGLPMIATYNCGGPDIIRDGTDGYLVPAFDSEALKQKIEFLYVNEKFRRELGENSFARSQQGFTMDQYAERFAAMCEKLIQARGGRA